MKTTIVMAVMVGSLAVRGAELLPMPVVKEMGTNLSQRVVFPPQLLRKVMEAYAAENPPESGYLEKVAEALEKSQERVLGILVRQQQQLNQLKAPDPTPAPADETTPPPKAPVEALTNTLAQVEEVETNAVPTAVAPPPVPEAAGREGWHRLLIELESPSPILFRVHTNAPTGSK
jgi:hypothetical protein